MGVEKPESPYAELMLDPGGWPEVDENDLYDQAKDYILVHKQLADVHSTCLQQMRQIFEGGVWSGDAANAAHSKLLDVSSRIERLVAELRSVYLWYLDMAALVMSIKEEICDVVVAAEVEIDLLEETVEVDPEAPAEIAALIVAVHEANVGMVTTIAEAMQTGLALIPDEMFPKISTSAVINALPDGTPLTPPSFFQSLPNPSQQLLGTTAPTANARRSDTPQPTPAATPPDAPRPTPGAAASATPPSPPGETPAAGIPTSPAAVPNGFPESEPNAPGGRSVAPMSSEESKRPPTARPGSVDQQDESEEKPPLLGSEPVESSSLSEETAAAAGSPAAAAGSPAGPAPAVAPVAPVPPAMSAVPTMSTAPTPPGGAAAGPGSGAAAPVGRVVSGGPPATTTPGWSSGAVAEMRPAVGAGLPAYPQVQGGGERALIPVSAARAERDAIAAASTARPSTDEPDVLTLARRIAAALNAADVGGWGDFGFFWVTAVTTDDAIVVANSYGVAYIPDGVQLPELVEMASADEAIPASERARWATRPVIAVQCWAAHHNTQLRAVIGTEEPLATSDPGVPKIVLEPDDIPATGKMTGRSRLEVVDPVAADLLAATSDGHLIDLLPPPPVDVNLLADRRPALWFEVLIPMTSEAEGRDGAHLSAFHSYAAHAHEVILGEAQTAVDFAAQRAAIADWLYWRRVAELLHNALAVAP
ncbi:hypothetical protein F0Q45_23615 [Mycobacterium simiae]|uniref:Secretion protein EspK n=1 Tax=Mycobacterium simiae TaxID=1784 RepID=A0A5B1BF95_MYCSI|nr:hypothetical protein [Mycobacterium simiae]KAA1246083.1 hypothetical protein F0Q45_23615 [Mycobacterium simiae]